MAWSLSDPGLPPLPGGRAMTPPPEVADDRHRLACWFIVRTFRGARARGRAARRRLAGVPDEALIDARAEIARELRQATEEITGPARDPLRDRALLIELAGSAWEVREPLVEVAAVGVEMEVMP